MSIADNPRCEALNLFGEQSFYTQNELEAYEEMLNDDSVDLGINIFDYFDDER